jgi:hypothetical protein
MPLYQALLPAETASLERFDNFSILVINVGKELVYGDLDITRIVNLMHDVERIKCLLFNNEQLDIFNYLPKPRIHIESLVEERGKPEIEQITIEPPIF